MDRLIFRNDDVNANTDPNLLQKIYGAIHTTFPDSDIWSCITLFSQQNIKGSIYKETPFKNNETNWFYKSANIFMPSTPMPHLFKIASHGLYHIDHSSVSRETQEMSILGSCSYLRTNKFVPPFNKYNQDTLDICFDNDIQIIPEGWKSLEHEIFDPSHKHWYFHSWRWSPGKLKEVLGGNLQHQQNS